MIAPINCVTIYKEYSLCEIARLPRSKVQNLLRAHVHVTANIKDKHLAESILHPDLIRSERNPPSIQKPIAPTKINRKIRNEIININQF
jgi:hypothetical protein